MREMAAYLEEWGGPRDTQHETEGVKRFMEGYYAAMDKLSRMADKEEEGV